VTPRSLDADSMLGKLVVMRRMLAELKAMGPFDHDRIQQRYVDQLAAERVLTGVVDLAAAINTHVAMAELGDAPLNLAESFHLAGKAGLIDRALAEQLAPSTGMRNILIHAYADLDIDKFLAAIPMAIEQYGRYIEQVARWLLERQKGRP
jgi:uncharacterized protein YutE (UPF0331/DUF86 family)